MIEEFVSAKDRIVSASIELISDAGLSSFTIPNISRRTNISEMMIYKYYSNTDEILQDIVSIYFKFDKGILKTLEASEGSYVDKIRGFVEAYASYYNSYYSLSSIMLQYEELLHNTETRETMVQGFIERRDGLAKLFDDAVKSGELKDSYDDPRMLADLLLGIFVICSINRRVMNRKRSYKEDILLLFDNWINTIIREV